MTDNILGYSFDEFSEFVESYINATAVKQQNFTLYAAWVNGVKCEIKPKHMTFGYQNSPEDIAIITEALVDAGYSSKNNSKVKNYVHFLYEPDEEPLECWASMCAIIDQLTLTSSTQPPNSGKKYSGINEVGIFTNIATVIKAASDTKMYDMIDRSAYDAVDHIISLNAPLSENSYREHIVPCVMITQHAFEMYDNGASILEVAAMIQQNLFIVHITAEQADYIDHTLGLKTTMPFGWKFGDSVFARLDAAGINY